MFMKIWEKILFEIRMQIMDSRWRRQLFHCWEVYPPSFYYRYTQEQQKKIMDRDFADIKYLIDDYYKKHGIEYEE